MSEVAINGFGRIGRLVLRAILKFHPEINVVAINDLTDAKTLAHLFKYDSVHHIFDGEVSHTENSLIVGGKTIRIYAEKDPETLPWKELGVDYVIESTGVFNNREKISKHFKAGASKAILTAPAKDEIDATVVMGVNHLALKPEHAIVSNASCTTNCLAPVANVLHDTWGIKRGLMTTIHPATISQQVVDGASPRTWRNGRSILENIIPCSTSSASALGAIIPPLKGKLTGLSFRVPTSDVSAMDLTLELDRPASYTEICTAMKAASEGAMKGVLGYSEEKVVATDFRGDACTSIFDAEAGIALDSTFIKIVCWYDNEWGYANKLLEMAQVVSTMNST